MNPPSPIKVLYVSDSGTVSGAENVMLGHLDRLKPPRYQPHVALRASNDRLASVLDARGVPYTRVAHFSRTPIRTTADVQELAHFVAAIARSARALAEVIRRHDIDVVHSIMYPASLYVAVACRMTGRSQIWHEHGIKKVHTFNKPIYRWVSATCALVIGPSNAVMAPLLEAGIAPAKVRTVYNGIDLSLFDASAVDVTATRAKLGLAADVPAIGLFGQMLPYKGQGILIEAAPAVLQRFPGARFFLVGALENPSYEERLRARIQELGLGDAFTFTGWRSDVHAVMACMDAIVVPTITPEPAALTLMESMALQRPLIASRTGGTMELVPHGEAGLLFEPGDSAAMAAALCRVLDDRDLSTRLGQFGRRRMERNYSLDRHVSEMDEIYRSCMVAGRSGA